MSAGLDVEELAELLNVEKIAIDAHAEAKGGVHFESQRNFQGDIGIRLAGVP